MSTQTADAATPSQARRGREFRYESYRLDPASGLLSCRYSLDRQAFEERVTFSSPGPAPRWDSPVVAAAARLIFLLAGVSYYKTAAPPVISMGGTALTSRERAFLRAFYLDGLGEFGYRNGIDLSGLRIEGPEEEPPPPAGIRPAGIRAGWIWAGWTGPAGSGPAGSGLAGSRAGWIWAGWIWAGWIWAG